MPEWGTISPGLYSRATVFLDVQTYRRSFTRALAERLVRRRTYWLAQGNVAEPRIKARREEMGILRKALDWAARPSRGKPERLPARGRDIRLWQAEQLRG
jgi:hypothetical protein